MKPFMDEDFLLMSGTARLLYHSYAGKMPIADYHCHINPQEIWEDRRFDTITEAWLEADHYKWRLMRAAGCAEALVTGDADDKKKFRAFAGALSRAAGNPIFHWAHLELKRYFGFDGVLSPDNADEVFELCNARLKDEDMSVRGLIKQSHVKVICTTDDPADSLEYHKLIAGDKSFETAVLPAWRPEKAMNPAGEGFCDYIKRLGQAAGVDINSVAGLKSALSVRLDFFEEMGCSASDHSLSGDFFRESDIAVADEVFAKGMRGEPICEEEIKRYQSYLMLFLGGEYARRGWVMQLHMGPVRNTNPGIYRMVGADAGCDCIGQMVNPESLAEFFGRLEENALLPKTVTYSMNPNDNMVLQSLGGCFQAAGTPGKIQHGSAWWFNDTKKGMEEQLSSLASSSLIGGFIGMLTDSRSFLSYTRHEYFRRILCNYLGGLVESGEYPEDIGTLGGMVEDICYNNTINYFGFEILKKTGNYT